jgi:hypothetical protein
VTNYDSPDHYKHFGQVLVNVNFLFEDLSKRGWVTGRAEHYESAHDRSDRCGQKVLDCIQHLLQTLRFTDELIGGPHKYSLGRYLVAEIEVSTAALYRDLLAALQTMGNYNARQYDSEDKLWARSFLPPVLHKWHLYVMPLLLAIQDLIGEGKFLAEPAFDGLSFVETKQVVAALRLLPAEE